jgi:hypothetical protein
MAMALASVWIAQGKHSPVLAQGSPLDCSNIVTNGSFEGGNVDENRPVGWTGTGEFDTHRDSSYFNAEDDLSYDGDYHAHISPGGVMSQVLDTSALGVGDTITIDFHTKGYFGGNDLLTITLGTSSTGIQTDQEDEWMAGSISYTLTSIAEAVTLSFSGDNPLIDGVSASCTAADPTPTPSPTATATATATSTPDSIADITIPVTGDPRFPIEGSAAIPGESGLTYTLATPPAIGSVTVNADGSFTYTAPSTMATGDTFTVLATPEEGETAIVTVVITFEIDKTVPTQGKVGSGGTGGGGGGDATDSRSPSDSGSQVDAEPTSTPSGGRVQR